MSVAAATVIDGVEIVPLRKIADERGAVFQMLKATDPHFVGFGEVYFSSVLPGVVKAWKLHRSLTANYACLVGRIRVALFDDRPESQTRGNVVELEIDAEDAYALVVIPPGIWHGFQGLAAPQSLLANCASEPSDPDELVRRDPGDEDIPYEWRALR